MSTITVEEKPDSRGGGSGDSAGRELRYLVRHTADDAEVQSALLDEAPTYYNGLVRQGVDFNPVFVDIENPDRCVWEGVARYGVRKHEPDTGDSTFHFDTTGATEHITQSIQTRAYYGDPDESFITDHLGAIGVQNGNVEGVDIPVPQFQFSERHYLDASYVTGAYKQMLKELTGKINDAQWRGFEAGEVMFLGAVGDYREGKDDWEMGFNFAARDNVRNKQIGNITGIDKRAWDYLWVQYKTKQGKDIETGEDTHDAIPVPKAVFVEQVAVEADFSKLGIGT